MDGWMDGERYLEEDLEVGLNRAWRLFNYCTRNLGIVQKNAISNLVVCMYIRKTTIKRTWGRDRNDLPWQVRLVG